MFFRKFILNFGWCSTVALLSTNAVFAQPKQAPQEAFEECILEQIINHPSDQPLSKLETYCREKTLKDTQQIVLGPISKRTISERQAAWNRHLIIPHRQNFFLPYAYSNNLNDEVYQALDGWADDFMHNEAIMQLSIKVPLTSNDVLRRNDGLYFGMTVQSWWQVYSGESSRPFRETNYEPELFYTAPLKFNFLGGNTGFIVGFSHQSNGRSQLLSRSWNRIYAAFLFEKDDFAFGIQPWYRIQEDPKDFPNDPRGDDNPDIEQYLGNFDIRAAKRFGNNNELSLLFRNNLREQNRGAIQLGYSFPFPWKNHLKGFIHYFNGYGESLIDYNHHQERFGVGVLLTDFL